MSFGGGAFSFGSNNNQQQGTGFGGFGGSNNNTGGFGSSTSNTGFGNTAATTNPFGGGGGGGGGGFGASSNNTGGFGANTNTATSLFGNKPAPTTLFGSNSNNTGGGLFGSNNNTTTSGGGFGAGASSGFGSTSNNAFGSGGTGGSSGTSFGGFGSSNATPFGQNSASKPLFGQGGTGTTGGFGSTGAFGSAGSGTALNSGPPPPAEGTLAVPFNPTSEKEGPTGTNITYHSLTFQPPYAKYSFDELRLADYNAGRRYGNAGQQAGAFGASNFGGFGNNSSSGGGFGSSTNNNPFGQSNSSAGGFGGNTSTSFGSNTGGGLFGTKPAAGGLFGQQSSAAPAGGLFSTSNNATTSSNPFGGSSSSGFGSNTGGGLFGNTQNQQNKPGVFGNAGASNTSTSFSFGQNNQSNPGSSLFGNNQQQQPQQTGGLFGTPNNQQKPSIFGNSTGTGFGPSATPGQSGGFGSTNNTGGGLFGNQQSSNTGGGLFGNNASGNVGGIFAHQNQNANKPAGLFGGSSLNTNQPSTGGGLFGNNNTAPNQSGGLFGNNSNQQSNAFNFGPSKPVGGLFGGNASANQSAGLFSNNNNNSSSMFGGSMSQPQQNMQQQDGVKHSSLLDPNPYGQSSIWTGLPAPNMENSKPLVTPLVATEAMRQSQQKPPPSLRLTQSRYMTPPRRPGTYGFTYSTYGTPNSAASTPGGNGLSNSMYGSRFSGGSFGRAMNKAASVSNLRSQFSESDSVLTPGAFSSTTSRYSSGSIRRLHIDRSIKSDLFTRPPMPSIAPPPPVSTNHKDVDATPVAVLEPAPDPSQKLKKRVSFEGDGARAQNNGLLNGESGALVRAEEDGDDDSAASNGRQPNGVAPHEQARGKELAVVPEDRESESPAPKRPATDADGTIPDPEMGDYWMKPTRSEMSKMSREQLKSFEGFEVGRNGAGMVRFDDPVDLTNVPWDELFSTIIEIRARSVTVYPNPETKPPRGKGLNVPSTIWIENSWPRAKGKAMPLTSGHLFEKHLSRLKKIINTKFESYDANTGVWKFTVQHYTRYGLDYEDDNDDMSFGDSQLSPPPSSLDQEKTANLSVMEVDSDNDSSRQDDTFSFKQKTVPGGFGRNAIIDDEPAYPVIRSVEHDTGSEHSGVSVEEVSDEEMDIAGSFPGPHDQHLSFDSPNKPNLLPDGFGTPGKALLDLDGDWAEQLQRTISPRKQNRDQLREMQNKILLDRAYSPIKPQSAVQKKDFRTSLDVMNAIFDKPERRARASQGRGMEADFEFPYPKRAKVFDPDEEMNDSDRAWHESFKTHFTQKNQLVSRVGKREQDGDWQQEALAADGDKAIALSQLKRQQNLDIPSLVQYADVATEKSSNIPRINYSSNIPFSLVKSHLPPQLVTSQLPQVYELLHVLVDVYEDEFTADLSEAQRDHYTTQIARDRLSQFLERSVSSLGNENVAQAERQDGLEAAVQYLARHDIKAAADALMKTKNFHLAILVSQIDNADNEFQEQIRKQIDAWRQQNALSEMTLDTRALYALLSGNTTIVTGKVDGPVEDRAETFTISKKYGFSWLQAFALNCWYGTVKNESIADWIEDFHQKTELGEESAKPNDDILWIAMKLFASVHKENSTIQPPVFPAALSSLQRKHEVSAAFHLHQQLTALLPKADLNIDTDKADSLAATLAAQAEANAYIPGAVYALLHLRSPSKRSQLIQDLLNRHADTIPLIDASSISISSDDALTFTTLTTSLKLPIPWIAKAKALYARSIHASTDELRYLVIAQEFDEAHECFCRRVAPRLVVGEDYTALSDAIGLFERVKHKLTGWSEGAQVFADFVRVVDPALHTASLGQSQGAKKSKRSESEETSIVLERLRKGLEGMKRRLTSPSASTSTSSSSASISSSKEGLLDLQQRVAIQEMARVVAHAVQTSEDTDHANADDGAGAGAGVSVGLEKYAAIMALPLTGDEMVSVGRGMAVDYYGRVMRGQK